MTMRIYSDAAERRSARRRRRWSAANAGNQAARAELLEGILAAAGTQLEATAPVLDVGCGTGWLLEALTEQGVPPGRLHGVELDPERVLASRRRVPGAQVTQGDARHLDHASQTFGVVTLLVSLSSMGSRHDARRALLEALRVLVPGGVLLCYEPRIATPLNPSTRLLRRSDLRSCGIDPGRSTTLTLLPPLARRLGMHTGRLYPLLARMPPLRTHRLYRHYG